jgi:hypothetical protein
MFSILNMFARASLRISVPPMIVSILVVFGFIWRLKTRKFRAVAAAKGVDMCSWLVKYLFLRAKLMAMSCLRPINLIDKETYVASEQQMLEHCSGPLQPNYRSTIKDILLAKDAPLVEGGPCDHPQSAAIRAFGRGVCHTVAKAINKDSLFLYASEAEAQIGDEYQRHWIVPKDLKLNYKDAVVKTSDVVIMVDVDYFIDLNKYLKGNVLLLFTFIPDSAGESGSDYCFTLSNNRLSLHVGGSVTYTHELWDHSGDSRFSQGPISDWVYEVYKVRLAPNRYIVVYQPVREVFLHRDMLDTAYPVSRLHFSFGRANVIAKEEVLSISHSGAPKSYDLPRDTFESMITRSQITPDYPLRMADVSACLPKSLIENHVAVSSIVSILLSSKVRLPPPNLSSKAKISNHSYTLLPRNVDEESKDLMHQICRPIITGSIAPVKAESTSVNAVTQRVLGPQNDTIEYSDEMIAAMDAFVSLLVPSELVTSLVPYTYEEVWDQQARPTQRATATQAARRVDCDIGLSYQAFIKAEAYQSYTDARNIACPRVEYRIKKARFVYPFMKHVMYRTKWYVFGRTPVDTAHLVCEYVRDKATIDSGDQSRMDGHHGRCSRLLIEKAMTRAFAVGYQAELYELLNKRRKGYTSHNQKYTYKFQNASGDGETTLYNSLASAFIDFYMFVQLGFTPFESFDKIGLIAGDDTLQDGQYAHFKEETSKLFGFVYKSLIVERGAPLVYLGRVYLNPWVDIVNICQPKRLLTKLHLSHTHINSVPEKEQCARKALAYMITDPHTPVVLEWCLHHHSTSTAFSDLLGADVPYAVKQNPPDAWIPLYPRHDDPRLEQIVAQDLGLSLAELSKLRSLVASDPEPYEPYLVIEPKISTNCIVRDIPRLIEKEEEILDPVESSNKEVSPSASLTQLMSTVAPEELLAPPKVAPPIQASPKRIDGNSGFKKTRKRHRKDSARAPLNLNNNNAAKASTKTQTPSKATK